MLIAFTYLPGFVTMVFRSMPIVWRGRHRLMLCWLIFMQAVSPGRKTLEEMARWTPATITAWRFGRLLTACPMVLLRHSYTGAKYTTSFADTSKSRISTQLFGDEAPTGAYKSYSRYY